jgi:hypothetical protein
MGTAPLIAPEGTHGRKPGADGRPYRQLKSFQLAQLVYDVTARFCDRYIDRRSRTHDQMVQAARSGVQNIAEGSKGERDIAEDGTEADKRGAGEPGGTAAGFRGLSAAARAGGVEAG